VLTYKLSCATNNRCGVSALWKPASPLPKRHDPAISLWIRFSPDVEVSLLATNTSGETFQFPIGPTLEHPQAGAWQYAVIPLTAERGMQGRVAETGIQVRARTTGIVTGSVSFDELAWRDSSETFHADPLAATAPPARNAQELGVNIHLLRDDHSLDLARAAGFTFVRMDMLWSNVERGGRYRFFAYDTLLRELDARKMGVLWILDYGHLDHGGSPPRTPADIAAFARFAEAAATHFKGRNVRYEIWNEPNLSQFWAPGPNAAEYAALLRAAVAAIRGADPDARISSGGISRFDTPFLSRALDPPLAANLTAIGIHPYPKAGPESIAPELESLREGVRRAFGDHLEVWDTEWGYSSTNAPRDAPSNGHTEAGRRRQAVLAVREMLTIRALGLPLAVYYDLRDDGTNPADPEHNYGLLDSSGEEKPAMKALRILAAGTYAGMVQETPFGIHAMRVDGPKDTTLIVWTDQPHGHRTIESSKQNLISATNLSGDPVKNKLEIDEPSGPIYLTWSK
jgi:hypothetical protein